MKSNNNNYTTAKLHFIQFLQFFFFVQGLIKEFKTVMLQSCPALIIKKSVNSHTCNVHHLAKVLLVLMSLNIYRSGKNFM